MLERWFRKQSSGKILVHVKGRMWMKTVFEKSMTHPCMAMAAETLVKWSS